MENPSIQAWNNFVMNSNPAAHETGSAMRNAALANLYMGLANNGGINSFLTCSWDVDADEVLAALHFLSAHTAAKELGAILHALGAPLPASSQAERWDQLERLWTEELDDTIDDVLSTAADRDLMEVLKRHVRQYESFYSGLSKRPPSAAENS
jgi:hypothetical protein